MSYSARGPPQRSEMLQPHLHDTNKDSSLNMLQNVDNTSHLGSTMKSPLVNGHPAGVNSNSSSRHHSPSPFPNQPGYIRHSAGSSPIPTTDVLKRPMSAESNLRNMQQKAPMHHALANSAAEPNQEFNNHPNLSSGKNLLHNTNFPNRTFTQNVGQNIPVSCDNSLDLSNRNYTDPSTGLPFQFSNKSGSFEDSSVRSITPISEGGQFHATKDEGQNFSDFPSSNTEVTSKINSVSSLNSFVSTKTTYQNNLSQTFSPSIISGSPMPNNQTGNLSSAVVSSSQSSNGLMNVSSQNTSSYLKVSPAASPQQSSSVATPTSLGNFQQMNNGSPLPSASAIRGSQMPENIERLNYTLASPVTSSLMRPLMSNEISSQDTRIESITDLQPMEVNESMSKQVSSSMPASISSNKRSSTPVSRVPNTQSSIVSVNQSNSSISDQMSNPLTSQVTTNVRNSTLAQPDNQTSELSNRTGHTTPQLFRPPASSLVGSSTPQMMMSLTSHVAGPPNPHMAGPPTPHMAGPPTPNMTGPPTPNMAGPPTPHMAGPPTPHMAGPLTPHMAGPQTPHMAGPQTPHMAGPSMFNMRGPQTPTSHMMGPPTSQVMKPPLTSQMVGPPTTQMAGPPTSRMAGPPTSRMAGPPTPHMAGPPTPHMAGPPTPRMAGPPTPRMAGPPTSHMAGPPTSRMPGPPTSRMPGPPTSRMPGPPTSRMAGPPTSHMAGPPTSHMAGPPTSHMAGPPTSHMAGPPTSHMAGPPTSHMAGPPTSHMAGPPTSHMAGPPTSHMAGPPTSRMPGPPTSYMPGPPTSHMAGPPTSHMAGPPTSHMPGPPTSYMSGPPTGTSQMARPPTSQMMSPMNSSIQGPPPSNAPSYTGQGIASTAMKYGSRPPLPNINQVSNQLGGLSVTRDGWNKGWGTSVSDLLQQKIVIPPQGVVPPKPILMQDYLPNCSPDIFRCTISKIPESQSVLQKSRLPFGVLIHPFKDLEHLAVVSCNTIVRCRSCRTYINPFVVFKGDRKWECNLCYRVNELPDEFQFDPLTRTYGDPSRRPEVKEATIEFIAPQEYMLRPPQPATYVWVLDVSRQAIETGYLKVVCDSLLSHLDNIPGDRRTMIGFITYSTTVQFYLMGEDQRNVQILEVGEIDDIFIPNPDDLLVNLEDSRPLIEELLTSLPETYATSIHTQTALGAALTAAYKLIAPFGGRITTMAVTLPTIGPGALISREDPNQRSANDISNLGPSTDFYKKLALDCSGQQVAVDLFTLNSHYIDLATLSGMSKFSGGCIHHFPMFSTTKNPASVEPFKSCLDRYITRKIGFEAVMRIRVTRGLSITNFHGNFFVRSTDLLSLPNINPDAGFGMQISIEEPLHNIRQGCFQAALLYTSSRGERRIRVHTLCLPVSPNIHEIIVAADQQAIVDLLAKMAVEKCVSSRMSDAREAIVNACTDILSAYKASQSTLAMGLSVPNTLQILPLYLLALLKSVALRHGVSTKLDDRVYAMCMMKMQPLKHVLLSIYPDLYPIHNLNEIGAINIDDNVVPQPGRLHLSAEYIDRNGAYLMDCGSTIYVYVRSGVSGEWVNNTLGVPSYAAIPQPLYEEPFPQLDNATSDFIRNFISYLQRSKAYAVPVYVIKEDNPMRNLFIQNLVDDRSEGSQSYMEFLQYIKSQVK